MSSAHLQFPLYEKAERAGVLDGASALLVAPTGTGKSFIGREALRRALLRRAPGTHAYLVPFRALAEEVYAALGEGTRSTPPPGTGSRRRAFAS